MKTGFFKQVLWAAGVFLILSGYHAPVQSDCYYSESEIEDLAQKVRERPDDYEALFKLACAYVSSAGMRRMIDQYPALMLTSSKVKPSLLKTSKYNSLAETTIDRLIQLNPNDGRGYLLKMNFESSAEKKKELLEQAMKAAPLDRRVCETNYNMLMEDKKRVEALRAQEEAIRRIVENGMDGDSVNIIRLDLAKLYLSWLKDEERAVQLLEDADRAGLSESAYDSLLGIADYAFVVKNKRLRETLRRIFHDPKYAALYQARKYNLVNFDGIDE